MAEAKDIRIYQKKELKNGSASILKARPWINLLKSVWKEVLLLKKTSRMVNLIFTMRLILTGSGGRVRKCIGFPITTNGRPKKITITRRNIRDFVQMMKVGQKELIRNTVA